MEDSKLQLLAKLRDSANVLVTVTANPSVDQLAAAIGLTLLLNKLGKHATAIFSGQTPDVMEFLKPEATLEKNTDSLRDFIISLDKAKADKLRYKVEDTVVKIFITPYHSALTDKDLEFSQGDYNVDLVVAIGAHASQDLDKAITSHGQILHDAVISSINNQSAGNLGTINWEDNHASSLCEMIFDLTRELQPEGLDPQMATALLTGIVSETRRFGNDKTTAKSLETSSLLVAAGANQQLVAAKLEEKPAPIPEKKTATKPANPEDPNKPGATDTHQDPEAVPQTDGTVTIDHNDDKPAEDDIADINIDEQGKLQALEYDNQPAEPAPAPAAMAEPQAKPAEPAESAVEGGSKLLTEPPTLGDKNEFGVADNTGNVDPLSGGAPASAVPLLSHDSGPAQMPDQPSAMPLATPPAEEVPVAQDVDTARDAVNTAAAAVPDLLPKPKEALNAQTVDLETPIVEPAMPGLSFTTPAPSSMQHRIEPLAPVEDNTPTTPSVEETNVPPPVPPPLTPSFATTPAEHKPHHKQAPKKPDFSSQAL